MKLYTRTPGGDGLGLDIQLTGQVTERSGKIHRVEVALPIGCVSIVGYSVKVLSKTPGGSGLLWADPGDICTDGGGTVSQEDLRAEVVRVNDEQRADMMRGPLGENWP